MSGFQFVHIESYARAAGKGKHGAHNLASIADEAERMLDACPHVENPAPPVRLYGCSPSEAAKAAEEWAEQAQDQIGRKLRKDGLCLLAGVASLPREREADWPAYRTAIVEHLKQHYGERLKSVIEHTDEAHPHLHFYVVPQKGERFEVLHAGRQAAYEAKQNGELKGAQNSAYKEAMREWQNDFHKNVSLEFGLARLGPARRRLSREEWQREQAATRILGAAEKIKKHGIKPVEPEPAQLLKVDWEKARSAAGEGKKSLFGGEETFTAAQLEAAMKAAASQAAFAARQDEQRRFKPIIEQASKAESAAIAGQEASKLAEKVEIETQKRFASEKQNRVFNAVLGEIQQYAPEVVTIVKERKQAAEAAEALRQENLRIEAEKRARTAEIATEREKRSAFLLKHGEKGAMQQINAGISGASSAFADLAAKAARVANGRSLGTQDWLRVEQETIHQAIGKNGQSPDSTIKAIRDLSPVRVTEAEKSTVANAVMSLAPQLQAEFKASRSNSQGNEHTR